ncbi:MAG: hypothetical protein V9G12_15610 [Microthrixaceae bacterium]
MAVLGPVLARPLATAFGVPLRLRGVSGELATRNAMRNPKRTARTASSLMIGVGLVGFITVFAASMKTSIAGSLETEFVGTHIVQSGAFDNSAGLSPELAERTPSANPEVDAVSQRRDSAPPSSTEPDRCVLRLRRHHHRSAVHAGFDRGRPRRPGRRRHRRLGRSCARAGLDDRLDRAGDLPDGDATFTVEAIYSDGTDWVGAEFVDLAAFRANGGDELDFRVYVAGDESAIEAWPPATPRRTSSTGAPSLTT